MVSPPISDRYKCLTGQTFKFLKLHQSLFLLIWLHPYTVRHTVKSKFVYHDNKIMLAHTRNLENSHQTHFDLLDRSLQHSYCKINSQVLEKTRKSTNHTYTLDNTLLEIILAHARTLRNFHQHHSAYCREVRNIHIAIKIPRSSEESKCQLFTHLQTQTHTG